MTQKDVGNPAFKAIHILDWYDGTVVALLQQIEPGDWLVAFLLAWSPDRDTRVYGLVPMEANEAAEILAMEKRIKDKDALWAATKTRVESILRGYGLAFSVVACRDIGEPVIAQACADASALEDYICDVEVSLSREKVDHWYPILGIP